MRTPLPIHLLALVVLTCSAEAADNVIGAGGNVGCAANPRMVARLQITNPGLYENYLVEGNWAGGNRVKITADDVSIRNCEIRNATGNGIGVFGRNVTIENCLFQNNEISFRLRGPTGRGDARISIEDCAIFDSKVGVRLEDKLQDLVIRNLGFGPGVARKYHFTGGENQYPGYDNQGEREYERFDILLRHGMKGRP